METGIGSRLGQAYPELNPEDLKVKFSRCQIAGLHEEGFKRCGQCGFMIRTEEMFCRLCRTKFRWTVRNARHNDKWVFSEAVSHSSVSE